MQKRRCQANTVPCKVIRLVNATHEPPTSVLPTPSSNWYIATLLKFVHQNISSYYNSNGKSYENGYPSQPNNLVVVSKTQRVFYNPITGKRTWSSEMKNLYIYFNYVCVRSYDQLFVFQLINMESNVKSWLKEKHVVFLTSYGIDL